MAGLNQAKQHQFLTAIIQDPTEAARFLESDPQYLHYRSSIGETAFHYLIVEGELERAATLLEWGADINTRNDFGDTPLMSAVQLGNVELVKWLVQRGADLELKNVNDETALALATSNESAAIFQFLISLPRKHPVDFYYDDVTAEQIHDDKNLVMRDFLVGLGLTRRFEH